MQQSMNPPYENGSTLDGRLLVHPQKLDLLNATMLKADVDFSGAAPAGCISFRLPVD
jgi:hypothetical protein